MSDAQIATLTAQMSSLQREFERHDKKDGETQNLIFAKLETIQRLVWIGIGGVIVIGGTGALIGGNILKILAR